MLSISIAGIDARELLCALPELALSAGSACTSALNEPSHVLQAVGLSAIESASTVRISLGRPTTAEEVERAGDLIILRVLELRKTCEQIL